MLISFKKRENLVEKIEHDDNPWGNQKQQHYVESLNSKNQNQYS